MRTLVFAERGESGSGLITAARQIEDGCEIYTASINGSSYVAGADVIVQIRDGRLNGYDPAKMSDCFYELCEKYSFGCILILATPFGRMLAPRLAMALKTGLVADVTAVSHTADGYQLIRPAFDGKLMAGIVIDGKGPVMASIRPGAFPAFVGSGNEPEIIAFTPENILETGLCLLEEEALPPRQDIRGEKILVSGGGGTLSDFGCTEFLAKALGGMAAASRRVVDAGIAPREIQVGQSGKTVSPKLYLALGIHGSMQHFEGLRDVDCIVSVNTNPLSPICCVSDIVVEGDAPSFARRLAERISRGRHDNR